MEFSSKTSWIDRRGATRTVPMQVLVLGYFRTGTACDGSLAMQQALEMLGYTDTHHMMNILTNPLETEMWTEAINAKYFGQGKPYGRAEWDQLLGHCQAVADNPSILFAEELLAAYPEAKVILTTREPEKWWKSYHESLQTMWRSPSVSLAMWLDPQHFGRVIGFAQWSVGVLLGGPVKKIEEADAKARFILHCDNVRRLVPKERLLEYRVGEGWERLCVFLGKEIPDRDFPWANDTQALRQNVDVWTRKIFRRTATRLVVPVALLIAAGIAIYAQHLL
ncbi:hypothetical protein B0H19DRAFT_1313523 [Mycena capillaripes]|nr:hypothetical protein B0H19DRAFT_1313523 [Mycena capillaripes]